MKQVLQSVVTEGEMESAVQKCQLCMAVCIVVLSWYLSDVRFSS